MLFEFNQISYSFSDGSVGFADLTGSVRDGDRLAILGTNGSGKSTLLRALNGFIEPTEGHIFFDGVPLSETTLREPEFQAYFRSRVGFVLQDADTQLFNATVAEEIAVGPGRLGLSLSEVRSRVEEILSFLGIFDLADRAPYRLSGGEKKKVAIASVLAMNPDVILLDEPFVGLDPRSQLWLISTLMQLQDLGKTTIMATHSLDTISYIADRALVLSEDHELIGFFPIDDLGHDPDILRRAGLLLEPELVELTL